MEVRDQRVHHLIPIARADEDLRVALLGNHPTVHRSGLQRAHAGGAHGDHPAAALPCGVDAPCRVLADLEILGVHLVLLHVLHLHRAEGAQAHVQQHRHDVHALCPDALHQLRREVQTRRGCGGAALLPGVHRLVALTILQFFVDVGRQRHLAQLVQRSLHRALAGEVHDAPAVLLHLRDGRHKTSAAEEHLRARAQLLARAHDGLPLLRRKLLQKQDLAGPAAGTLADQSRGDHAGLVDHQRVAGVQIVDDVVKMPVLDAVVPPVQHHQPAVIPRLHRRLRNALLRQIIHKIRQLHTVHPLRFVQGYA